MLTPLWTQAVFGMQEDLDLTVGNRYSWASAIFYLGYLAGTYPLTGLAQRFNTTRVVSVLIVLWGICLTLTVACRGYRSLYAERFFLGVL